ncbi:hypothetical protein AWC38_SpisGene6398 [Stylophora pistillata]|uniref:Integrase catalytic domain-containing protein n=1 Tax=Stylophora pistillata TaxID=50429 RepID=A0A2B4SG82_STYPI|nr:hypothetical protein AWC38_SpisGene6398 [Stylophora pistillata]
MGRKLSRVYYSPKGFWKGLDTVKKLAKEAGVPEDVAKLWLIKQAIWLIYLPAPKYVLRPTFDVESPNTVNQADLLFLPHDRFPKGRKVYKYALTVVDVTSRFKAAEPLTSKDSSEVSKALQTIYKRGPLRWPKVLQVDTGRECMGETANHDVRIKTGNVNVHRDEGMVERFNRTLGERLFTFQYGQEMNFKDKKRSTEWKRDSTLQKNVRYIHAASELEGGQRRATDPIWSLKVFNIEKTLVNEREPVLYYPKDGPKRGFVREELQIVPPKTELPPEGIR